tara:strand:- start:1076 stop:1462 length:387 start_codon:yes stop_codon:yes gene_type:complete
MNNKISRSSNKSFGIVFFIVFFVIALWPVFQGNDLRIWSLTLSIIFLILGLLNSKILTPLNIIWHKLGLFLGRIVSPIVLGLIYFFVVTPTGVIMRIFGKDLLGLKQSNKNSYWIKRKKNNSSMKNQF